MRPFALGFLLLNGLLPLEWASASEASAIVPPEAKLELLYTRTAPISGGLTEGAAVAPDGSIYFSEIPVGQDKGMIMRFDPKSKSTTVFAPDSHKSNGLMFDADGSLIACEGSDGGGRQVSRWNLKTSTRTALADRYQGKRFNAPNDLCIDLKGRIYFSDPRYLGTEPRELEHRAVYRIDKDGTVVEVTHDVEKPNGIALSPDQKTLYVADHNNGTDRIDPSAPPPKKGAMKVYAFPLGADGLVAGPRKTLVDFGDEEGSDGMTVDTDGNLYLASRRPARPGVLVLDAAGKELAHIPTGPAQRGVREPVGMPSNCDFGLGAESNVLYITVDKSLYRIRLNARGFHIPWADSVAAGKASGN
ncbi:MAG: SMP-30/gluconolactonase/LRE family protein [Isosphaeraceae bacterium]|nr:SMP-30/gluconolactonase/LRE family protein [Isosphaeraceae bacterium]